MIYGDTINQTDSLGLTNYAYRPNISAVMQSGNLYVYGINNPIFYQDYNGDFVITTAALLAVGKVALTKVVIPFAIGLVSQAVTDAITYAYFPDEFERASAGQYIWSGLTNTLTFGISNPIAKSAFSAFGSEIIDALDKAMAGKPAKTKEEVILSMLLNIFGDWAVDNFLNFNSILDEIFPGYKDGSTKNNKTNSGLFENNNAKDNVSDVLKILPNAYKSTVAGKPNLITQKQLLK